MGDRQPIRDRTLILRILVPGLETRLRDKMKEVEETANSEPAISGGGSSSSSGSSNKETLLDLDGVTCEPTQDHSTLWNFHCDGATYPARLVNLPCPLELHKTHDHAMYYKSCDVAQMLIVYEDSMALDEADAMPKTDGYPSYYHSGITPAMNRVVERRFALREHQPRGPPRNEVGDVERELIELMYKIAKEQEKKNKIPNLPNTQQQNKILEEVIEEVVDFEPWMDDYGRQQSGIEFTATDQIASVHPEIWLEPEKIQEIKQMEQEKEEEERKKKEAATAKKQRKKKKKEEKAAAEAAAAAAAAAAAEAKPKSSKKINVAANKSDAPIDEVTQAAMGNLLNDMENDDIGDGFLEDLGFDMDDFDLEGL